jgi:hypothetical protein
MKDPIELFKNLGYGIYFYFYFLKFFSYVMLIISLLSIALCIINTKGEGLERIGATNIIIKTSLGNINFLQLSED